MSKINKLSKAGFQNEDTVPDRLASNAFQKPAEAHRAVDMPSPWSDQDSIITSAPPPAPVRRDVAGMNTPMWMGKPIAHHDHHDELELNAAVGEFGKKLPRAEAEAQAYNEYVQKQRVSAAGHHLAGLKAAQAAGDMEAARKHGMMYNLHAKALGHEPVGPVHPAISQQMAQEPYKFKFKAHKGDLFAMDGGKDQIVSSAPPPALGKSEREALYTIYLGAKAVLAKKEVMYCTACKDPLDKDGHCKVKAHWEKLDAKKAELSPVKKKVVPCRCPAYNFPHRIGSHVSCPKEN